MSKEVAVFARELRALVVEMVALAGSGHVGGALGMAEVYALLYTEILKHKPSDPNWSDRDRLVLSCGHTAPARYAAMALCGYFPVQEILSLRRFGSRLQGHPSTSHMQGLETSSGPLGQGLSQALGMALEARRMGYDWHTYCITSDGEHQEGQTWEAVQLAGMYAPNNLTVLVDRNMIQIDGNTESVVRLGDIGELYRHYNWQVTDVAGGDISVLRSAFSVRESQDRPHCIIAHTTAGSGVSFMEHDYRWHGKAPSRAQALAALEELLK